jgi:hypothetical protein
MGINRVEGTRCISAAVTESPTGWTLNNLEEDQMLPLDQRPINQLPKPRGMGEEAGTGGPTARCISGQTLETNKGITDRAGTCH